MTRLYSTRRSTTRLQARDRGLLTAGALAFVASFLPFVGIDLGDYSGVHIGTISMSAWHGYAVAGLILFFAATVVLAARAFGALRLPELPVGATLLSTGASALGTLLLILRGLTAGAASLQWGGYLLLIAAIAQTVLAALTLREPGERPSRSPASPGGPRD
ncbi:MAG: hypothetical protein ACRDRL_28285 [Sciscionella sp.]